MRVVGHARAIPGVRRVANHVMLKDYPCRLQTPHDCRGRRTQPRRINVVRGCTSIRVRQRTADGRGVSRLWAGLRQPCADAGREPSGDPRTAPRTHLAINALRGALACAAAGIGADILSADIGVSGAGASHGSGWRQGAGRWGSTHHGVGGASLSRPRCRVRRDFPSSLRQRDDRSGACEGRRDAWTRTAWSRAIYLPSRTAAATPESSATVSAAHRARR